MPAHRLAWIKFWPELLEHRKFGELTDAESWTWVVVWGKASQQPDRWKFASIEHAARATGRPKRQIQRLVEVHLIDSDATGRLLIHDVKQWQERFPSDEHSANTPSNNSEHSVNGAPTLPENPPEHSANTPIPPRALRLQKGELRRKTRDVRDEDVEPPAPTERPPTPTSRPTKARRPISAETIEALVSKYGPQFGDEQLVREWIARALNHTARLKALDEALYVERTWLQPELQKLRERVMSGAPIRSSIAHEEECTCEQRRANLAVNRNSYPFCDIHGDVRAAATA